MPPPKTCKNSVCNLNAEPGNYGYCVRHRNHRKGKRKRNNQGSDEDEGDERDGDDVTAEETNAILAASVSPGYSRNSDPTANSNAGANDQPARSNISPARLRGEAIFVHLRYLLHGPRVFSLRGHKIYSQMVPPPMPIGNSLRWTLKEFNCCVEKNGANVPEEYLQQILEWGVAIKAVQLVTNHELGRRLRLAHSHIFVKAYAPDGAAGTTMIRHSLQAFLGTTDEACRALRTVSTSSLPTSRMDRLST
jgi:hypothetical protein